MYANISRKQKAPPKTLGGGNRTYNYNRKLFPFFMVLYV